MVQSEMPVPPAPNAFGASDDRNVRLLASHMRHARISNCRSSRPGLNRFFERQPSTSYWATFIVSLRDQSPAHLHALYVDAHGPKPGLSFLGPFLLRHPDYRGQVGPPHFASQSLRKRLLFSIPLCSCSNQLSSNSSLTFANASIAVCRSLRL